MLLSMYRKALFRNLLKALLTKKKIQTTEARAKVLRTFVQQKNGATRIVKLGRRKGDNAPMVLVELLEEEKAES